MVKAQWYELRVSGSAGTSSASGINEGIALSDTGRLCSVSSGQARKFDSEDDAIEFLSKTSVPGIYPFEPVLCRMTSRTEADGGLPSGGLTS